MSLAELEVHHKKVAEAVRNMHNSSIHTINSSISLDKGAITKDLYIPQFRFKNG